MPYAGLGKARVCSKDPLALGGLEHIMLLIIEPVKPPTSNSTNKNEMTTSATF